MRTFLAMFLLLFSALLQAGWAEGTVVGVKDDNSKGPGVFMSTAPSTGHAKNTWHEIDVTAYGVPADAKAVFLTGLLIITHGTASQTCDLTVSLKAPSNDMVTGNYIGQTVDVFVGSGERSNMSSWVPVENGKFLVAWNYTGNGAWPSYCSYGVNLSIQSYVR